MKILAALSILIAAAVAGPSAPQPIGQLYDVTDQPIKILPRQVRSTVNGEKILARMSETKPKDGAKRTTVKYGSFMVSSSKMISTTKLAMGPCGGNCYVTAMEATIRYPSGEEANVDTGAWLHHIALFGSGAGGGSIWAAGNERPTLRLNEEHKYGLAFPSAFMLMIDLMSEDTKAKNLTLEITYEHVPKSGGYQAARMYWLTIGEPAAKTGKYSFNTIPSMSSSPGNLLYAIGHMHDGGTDMQLFVSGKMVCKSVMHYNSRVGYGKDGAAKGASLVAQGSGSAHAGGHKARRLRKRDGPGGHGGHGGEHISDPGACTNFGQVKRGDSLRATANYDATKHVLMEMNGRKEKLMGNMRVYIGPTS